MVYNNQPDIWTMKSCKKKKSRLSYALNFCEFVAAIGLALRGFAKGPGDRVSIPGRVIPKTQKMVLDFSFLNSQHYKVGIKGKVEAIKGKELHPPLHFREVFIEKGAFGLSWTMVTSFTFKFNQHFTFVQLFIGLYWQK